MTGQHLLAVGDLELPHAEVHRLLQAGLLAALLVVGRVPGLLDHRLALEALDQHAALVVHREVHRPDHAVAAAARAASPRRRRAARGRTSGSSSNSRKPNMPQRLSWKRVEGVVDLRADAARRRARRARRRNSCASPCLKNAFWRAAEEQPALEPQRGDPVRRGRVQPVRELDELPQVPPRPRRDGRPRTRRRTLHARPPSTSSPRSAATSAPSSCAPRARPTCSPTSAALESARPRPVVEMEGAERIMLGSNNYLGLTGDERVMQGARDALERYGTGLTGSRLLNGTIDAAPRARGASSPSGWAPRTRSSSPPATRPTSARSARSSAPATRSIADSGDHASILDGCLLSRAKLRPFRHNRLDKLEKHARARRGRRRRRPRRRRRRLLDGGRRRAAARDRRAVRALRRAADGRRGARRRRARRARRRGAPSCSASRTASTCAWARSRSRWPPAAASSPARTRSSTSCASRAARSSSPPRPCRPPSAPRWPRCGSSARDEGRALFARVLDNARYLERRPRTSSASRSCDHGDRRSPRSSPCWSRTTGRPCCCGARSTTPASSSTSRCTRPSRPAARCCARA